MQAYFRDSIALVDEVTDEDLAITPFDCAQIFDPCVKLGGNNNGVELAFWTTFYARRVSSIVARTFSELYESIEVEEEERTPTSIPQVHSTTNAMLEIF